MRRRAPRPVASSIEAFVGRLDLPLIAELQRAWPEAAGPAFAQAAEPVAERHGVVSIVCVSAVWAQELDLMSERVVEALNERLGRPAVVRLRCEVSRRRI